ncbi:MAG: methyltransferase domain-containing protein, partial [Planctomycetes bacterium]|nr:methyltransferase domain-containing protein [Planctomycetota bacterium]
MDLPLRHEVERLLSADGLAPPAGLLNDLLVDYLVASGFVRSQHLEDSMRRWRRDLFLPEAELRHVFSDRAVITADDGSGWVASSCSTPSITTSMIEALEVEPGHRILEIGSGTGYATALLSSLEEGIEVVALECLEETAHEARNRIRDLQIKNVRIVTGDGRGDLSAFGIFDRILISCGVEELPRGWSDLLRPGGLIVL